MPRPGASRAVSPFLTQFSGAGSARIMENDSIGNHFVEAPAFTSIPLRRKSQSVSFTGPIHWEAPLTIEFDCSCGRALRVRDESLRGRKVKCPACGLLADVPGEPPAPRNDSAPPPPEPGRRRKRRPRRRGRRRAGQNADPPPSEAGAQKPAPGRSEGRAQGRAPDDSRQGDRPPRKRRPRRRPDRTNRHGGARRRDADGRRRLQPQEQQPVEIGGGIPPGRVKPPRETAERASTVERETPEGPASTVEKETPEGPVSSFFKRLFGR